MARSGRLDLLFRLWAWAVRILSSLLSMLLHSLFYQDVGNGQYAIHERREAIVFGRVFHSTS